MRRILAVFAVTAIVMLFIFHSADWYANNAALPRYCENPRQTVEIVREIISSDTPGEGKKRRPYIIAAKLIFLIPQEEDEPLETYTKRLRTRISQACGVAY